MTRVIDFLQQGQPEKALIVAKQLQQVLANTAVSQ